MADLAPRVTDPARAGEQELVDAFADMVAHDEYPCLGARSVFRQDRATVRVYDELAGASTTRALLADLTAFGSEVDPAEGFASFVALFRGPAATGELDFERLLWSQLAQLHGHDDRPWSDGVSSDPADDHFAFSVGGTAYFVVGLHPGASRDARRAAVPTLVFNLHDQFEELRASGRYARLRDTIRERDRRLQGDVNPMVCDHGETSEARQYSGRRVAADWQAPFEPDPDPDQETS